MSGGSLWIDANWNIWGTEEYLRSLSASKNTLRTSAGRRLARRQGFRPHRRVLQRRYLVGEFGVGGGDDETPEDVILGNNPQDDWSIMAPTNNPVPFVNTRYGYSIEELLTIDFEDVPSIDD